MLLKSKGKDLFCLGFNGNTPNMPDEYNDVLGYAEGLLAYLKRMDQLSGPGEETTHLVQEYVLHEALCNIVGHARAKEIQKILFPENYSFKRPRGFLRDHIKDLLKFVEDDSANPYDRTVTLYAKHIMSKAKLVDNGESFELYMCIREYVEIFLRKGILLDRMKIPLEIRYDKGDISEVLDVDDKVIRQIWDVDLVYLETKLIRERAEILREKVAAILAKEASIRKRFGVLLREQIERLKKMNASLEKQLVRAEKKAAMAREKEEERLRQIALQEEQVAFVKEYSVIFPRGHKRETEKAIEEYVAHCREAGQEVTRDTAPIAIVYSRGKSFKAKGYEGEGVVRDITVIGTDVMSGSNHKHELWPKVIEYVKKSVASNRPLTGKTKPVRFAYREGAKYVSEYRDKRAISIDDVVVMFDGESRTGWQHLRRGDRGQRVDLAKEIFGLSNEEELKDLIVETIEDGQSYDEENYGAAEKGYYLYKPEWGKTFFVLMWQEWGLS